MNNIYSAFVPSQVILPGLLIVLRVCCRQCHIKANVDFEPVIRKMTAVWHKLQFHKYLKINCLIWRAQHMSTNIFLFLFLRSRAFIVMYIWKITMKITEVSLQIFLETWRWYLLSPGWNMHETMPHLSGSNNIKFNFETHFHLRLGTQNMAHFLCKN